MATNQERFQEQDEPLKNNDGQTEQGRQEQVDYSNNAHRDGHDNEDKEDLDSMKGEMVTPKDPREEDTDAGV